ncbi:hypothetical protein JCM6882_000818 [Rhodosporidiobolus microsporus]
MRAFLLLCTVLGAVAQQRSDGDNLETFPTIIDDLTSTSRPSSLSSRSTNTPFNPTTFLTAPGPALPPSSYLTGTSLATATTASVVSRTLISASHASNSSLSMTSSGTPSLSESVVTSTVDGSVATVTITNSAAPDNAAGRIGGGATSAWVAAAGVAGAMAVGGAWVVC